MTDTAMKTEPPISSRRFPAAWILTGFLLGAASGWFLTSRAYQNELSRRESELKTQVTEKLRESGHLPPEDIEAVEVRAIGGAILEIGDGFFVLESHLQNDDPFGAPYPRTRTVEFAETTPVTIIDEKSREEFEEELAAWQALNENASSEEVEDLPSPPDPFIETEIICSDLRVGDLVTVMAEGVILAAERFTAEKIVVQQRVVENEPVE